MFKACLQNDFTATSHKMDAFVAVIHRPVSKYFMGNILH